MKLFKMINQAFLSLGTHKGKTILMMLGPAIGAAALIVVLSVVEGSSRGMRSRVKSFGDANFMILAGDGMPPADLSVTTLTVEDAKAIEEAHPHVKVASPGLQRRGMSVEFEGNYTNVPVFGVTPTWQPAWNWKVSRGRSIEGEDLTQMRRVCLIGQTVKEEIFGDVDPLGKTVRLGKSGFTVVGELARRGSSPSGGNMDNRLVIPLTTMMRRVANVQHVSHIRVVLKDSSKMQEIAEVLRKLLRRRHNIQPPQEDDFGIITPKTISKMTVEISSTLKTLLIVTAVICLLGGGVVVMAIMLMSVSERTNEIGIRRAVGATRRDILIQFLSEAVVSTTAGGLVGFAIGMGAMGAMLKLSKMQPVFTPWAILWGVVASVLIGVVFGLLPAYRAARLQPVDALRD